MTGHVYVSDSDREFRAVYGVTPGEVDEAIEENRSRIIRKLNEWGQVWAVDEIVMNIWQELIEGGLKRWASYADRRPLGAFVNSLVDQKIGEWMNTDRPKYRSGMTYAPQNRRHRNNTHDGNGGPADEPDAERIRRQLRAEIRAAARDRLCEPDDVFGTDDGDMIGAPPATRPAGRNGRSARERRNRPMCPTTTGRPCAPCPTRSAPKRARKPGGSSSSRPCRPRDHRATACAVRSATGSKAAITATTLRSTTTRTSSKPSTGTGGTNEANRHGPRRRRRRSRRESADDGAVRRGHIRRPGSSFPTSTGRPRDR